MRTSRTHQPLTYDVRLPDEAQADALRLLDASREVVNQALTLLWPYLDEFGSERAGPAWKQVGKYMGSPDFHGDRQWRCESEVVGRLLRQQAERKKAFELVAPILSDGFIRPKTEKRPAGKNRPAIKEAITTLQKSLEEDETSFVALQNVVEQCCNFFFQQDRFPYVLRRTPTGPAPESGHADVCRRRRWRKGQAYRLALDRGCRSGALSLPLSRRGRHLALAQGGHHHRFASDCLKERLRRWGTDGSHPARRAPSRRGAVRGAGFHRRSGERGVACLGERRAGAWGRLGRPFACSPQRLWMNTTSKSGRPFFLDTGGFDGRQARTRRQIDELKKKSRQL